MSCTYHYLKKMHKKLFHVPPPGLTLQFLIATEFFRNRRKQLDYSLETSPKINADSFL